MDIARIQRIMSVFLLPLFTFMVVAMIITAWPFTTDDAYITIRYAANWYWHHQLTWNVNSPPVEGYSNFLFVIFGYIAYVIHVDPVLLLKSIGVVSIIGSVVLTYYFARLWLDTKYALMPVFLLIGNYGLYWWGVSGLEVITFQMTYLATVYFFLRGLEEVLAKNSLFNARFFFIVSWFFCLASALLRFDGLIAAITVFVIAFFHFNFREIKLQKNRYILSYFSVFAILYFSYFVWRWHYFGLWMPNSYACKTIVFKKLGLSGRSFVILREFLSKYGLLYLFGFIFCLMKGGRNTLIVFIISTIYLSLFNHVDLVLGYADHYALPVIPFFFVFGVAGFFVLCDCCFKKEYESLVYFIVFLLMIFFTTAFLFRDWIKIFDRSSEYSALNSARKDIADKIAANSNPQDKVLLGDAGVMSYVLLNHPVEDMFCLNSDCYTKQCENSPQYAKCVTNHFFNQHPKYIVVNDVLPRQGVSSNYYLDSAIVNDYRFKEKYRKISGYKTPFVMYGYLLYQRV